MHTAYEIRNIGPFTRNSNPVQTWQSAVTPWVVIMTHKICDCDVLENMIE